MATELETLQSAIDKANSSQKLFVFSLGHYEHQEDAYRVIFDHDFAKALWGTEHKWRRTSLAEEQSYVEAWQHHLSEMALAEDRIAYLAENI